MEQNLSIINLLSSDSINILSLKGKKSETFSSYKDVQNGMSILTKSSLARCKQAGKQSAKQASSKADRQAGRQAAKQASKQAGMQAGKQEAKQAAKQSLRSTEMHWIAHTKSGQLSNCLLCCVHNVFTNALLYFSNTRFAACLPACLLATS